MGHYKQDFCPITRGSEIFAERWTPIIIRNLLCGCVTFSEISAGAPGLSDSLLSKRLRELERSGIVERYTEPGARRARYRLTSAGRDLKAVTDALGDWGARWLDTAPIERDPGIVLWAVARTMQPETMPDRRLVVRFELTDDDRQSFWLLIEKPEAELCRKDPGFEEDLVLRADSLTFAEWHMGHFSLLQAIRSDRMDIEGPRAALRALAACGGQTPFKPSGEAHLSV